ncbi:hypothetical protein Y032_0016g3083 [Ancylostoma ceylanicum]|uniref:Uncharacterized protein n=1 Tax=Ancylostoma ceylanicum TaxID=53326 RepID=A0A016V8J5_9BILA|nr:hypothetical protein Y032_0016g3083 [Ancylostoma ceylanicum]
MLNQAVADVFIFAKQGRVPSFHFFPFSNGRIRQRARSFSLRFDAMDCKDQNDKSMEKPRLRRRGIRREKPKPSRMSKIGYNMRRGLPLVPGMIKTLT